MKKVYFRNSPDFTYLNMGHCGSDIVGPGYTYGPSLKDYYMMAYVNKGSGIYKINNTLYRLQTGDSFFIFPGRMFSHKADIDDPWSHFWFSFYGSIVPKYLEHAGITSDNPIHHHKNPAAITMLFDSLFEMCHNTVECELFRIGLLNTFFYHIISDNASNNCRSSSGQYEHGSSHIQKAIHFINENYTRDISLAEIAGYTGLETKYFSKLFKKITGYTPWEYLLQIRIEKAIVLLAHTSIRIDEIAHIVGFKDAFYFSRIFKKHLEKSPSSYRKNNNLP